MDTRTWKEEEEDAQKQGCTISGPLVAQTSVFCTAEPIIFSISNSFLFCHAKIEAAEMKLLRPLAGYTLYDHKTNDYIRRELQITGMLDKIDEYIRNSFRHLERMPQNRIPLKSYYYRPQGRRTIGRPKKRWREQL